MDLAQKLFDFLQQPLSVPEKAKPGRKPNSRIEINTAFVDEKVFQAALMR